MSTIKSSNIPFNYKIKNGIISQDVNLSLYTEYDTDLKKTFVYQYNFFGSGKPLATIDSSGKVQPFQEDGVFTADQNLRTQFATNQNLTNALKASTRSAVKNELLKTDSSVSELEIDKFMGTTASASTAAAPPAPPPQAGTPAAGQPAPGGTQPATSTISDPTTFVSDDIVKDSDNVRSEYDNYTYPVDFSGEQDYVKFAMYRYKPKGLTDSPTLTNGINKNATNKGTGKGSVTLPIQSPASDTNSVGWGDGRLTGIEAAAFNIANSAITTGFDKAVTDAGGLLNDILTGSKSGQYRNTLGMYFAQQAAQVNDVFARATGGILNPNLELLFQAPELRSFNFTFKLSARDQPEADMIRKIIRFFKQGMSVKKSQSALFLKSPDLFDITYYRGGESSTPHKSLNRFKTCALKSFNVDYTPLGSYMTYADPAATMVAYTISMQFQEIDPVFDDDYDNNRQDEIGF